MTNSSGLTRATIRLDVLPARRTRLGDRRARAGHVGARGAAPPRGEDERHRLLVQDDRVFHEAVARLQLRARAHAVGRVRRERRESRAHVHRRLGRRRFSVDRARPALSCDPAERAHAVRDREQRRVRPHQGSVFGVSGYWLDVEEGRRQRSTAD